MKKLLLITMILSFKLISAPYETAQRFQAGDTISADVLNDILDRIELALKPIEASDLVGNWTATQFVCGGSQDPQVDAATLSPPSGLLNCNDGSGIEFQKQFLNAANFNNLAITRTDSVYISSVSGQLVNISFATNSMFYLDGQANTFSSINEPKTHKCAMLGDGAMLGCGLDPTITDPSNPSRQFSAFFHAQRLSSTRIKLFWGADRAAASFNVIILDKVDQAPKSPKNLTLSVGSNSASLSWTAGDSTDTGYNIQRKASSGGTFTSIGTSTAESYEDTTIALGNTYWYRVFATNANGSSVGSNVLQITYANTPPSMNLSSTISVNEGTTSVVSIGASDAERDSLTYTISNPNAGTDAEDLSVSSEGVITFNASPDWEIPTDYNTDNIYDIRVSVSDGTDTVSQDISVVVLDVNGS